LYERLVAYGGKGVSVRQLGGNRAGEKRRFFALVSWCFSVSSVVQALVIVEFKP
jgi:hypothetical protein